MRQLVWSPALVVMTTSRRSSRHFIGFISSASDLQDGDAGVEEGLHDAAPSHLADLCVPAASTDGRRQSRSAVSGALLVPWTRTSTDFAAYDPRTWNWLPAALRSPELSLSSFKRQLKTHLSVPALDSAGCSCACVSCRPTVVRRCCEWLYSEFGGLVKFAHVDFATWKQT